MSTEIKTGSTRLRLLSKSTKCFNPIKKKLGFLSIQLHKASVSRLKICLSRVFLKVFYDTDMDSKLHIARKQRNIYTNVKNVNNLIQIDR